MLRLDGSRAAASTIARKRALFHDAAGYAAELGLLPANPVSQVRWTPPKAAAAVNPQTVASPAQVRAILAEVARLRPELTAFFGCLYYAALRPEEAVALRSANLVLARHGRGKLILTGACPRTGSAWTSTGTPHEPRCLKHRPDGAVRVVPVPAALAGPAPAAPAQVWDRTGRAAVPRRPQRHPQRKHLRSHLARRPRDRARPAAGRHVTGPPPVRPAACRPVVVAERHRGARRVAARAGNSVHVLQDVYAHCTDGREDLISQQIEDALDPDSGTPHVSQCVTASGYTHRWHRPDAVRHMSVNDPSDPGVAHSFPAAHCPSVPRRLLLR